MVAPVVAPYRAVPQQRRIELADGTSRTVHGYYNASGDWIPCRSWRAAVAAANSYSDEAV